MRNWERPAPKVRVIRRTRAPCFPQMSHIMSHPSRYSAYTVTTTSLPVGPIFVTTIAASPATVLPSTRYSPSCVDLSAAPRFARSGSRARRRAPLGRLPPSPHDRGGSSRTRSRERAPVADGALDRTPRRLPSVTFHRHNDQAQQPWPLNNL